MRAIQVKQFGGPEVLELVDLPAPTPQGSLQLLSVTASGVNYADTHQAADDYLAPQTLPFVPGAEVVGVDADGRRVVALVPSGGYAEQALAHPGTTFALPDEVDDTTALAFVLQGTTAWHLLRTSARMAPGETVVVHAGAGGVGCLAVQLARELGARRIIATASSPEKRDLARDLGADVALDPGPVTGDSTDLRDALVEANEGRPVDIVLEMAGGRLFDASLRALAPVRPAGHLRDGLAGAPNARSQPRHLMATRRDRSSASGSCTRCGCPAGCDRRWRSCSTSTRPAGCTRSTAAGTRSSTPGRRTRTSPPGVRRASSCSTSACPLTQNP